MSTRQARDLRDRSSEGCRSPAQNIVLRLCQRDQFEEDIDFLVDRRPAAEQDVDELFEREKPKWNSRRFSIENLGFVAKAAAVLVVDVEQENVQIRTRDQQPIDDHGDAAGFADAGRSDDREMAAEHAVEVEGHANRAIGREPPDVRGIAQSLIENRAQAAAVDQADGVADSGVGRDASHKMAAAGPVNFEFPHKVDRQVRLVGLGFDVVAFRQVR